MLCVIYVVVIRNRTWRNAQIGDTMVACLKAKGDIFKEKKEDTEEKLKVRSPQ